jgi:hypothetical protein
MVVNPGRSRRDPGGAVPHRDGKGRSGTARLPGRYSLVPSGAEQSGSRVNIPGQNWDFEFVGFKGFFGILLI